MAEVGVVFAGCSADDDRSLAVAIEGFVQGFVAGFIDIENGNVVARSGHEGDATCVGESTSELAARVQSDVLVMADERFLSIGCDEHGESCDVFCGRTRFASRETCAGGKREI